MAGVTISSGGQSGSSVGRAARQPVTGRLVALARVVECSRRRQWEVRQLMLLVGATLMALGFVAIVLGWYGAAHSSYVFQEVPYLISGGLLGVALVAGGGFLFFAAWLVRLIEENRRDSARVAQTLDRVDRVLAAMSPEAAASLAAQLSSEPGTPAGAPPPAPGAPPPPPPPSSAGGGWA